MDVKYLNAFLDSFLSVLPQFGINDIEKKGITIKGKKIQSLGLMITIGVVGDIRGNIVYSMSTEDAKKIASLMMMGMPVTELDEMAKSALSELSNMLTANASINLSKLDVNVNISTPTLMCGENFEATLNSEKVFCIDIRVGDSLVETNISLEKI